MGTTAPAPRAKQVYRHGKNNFSPVGVLDASTLDLSPDAPCEELRSYCGPGHSRFKLFAPAMGGRLALTQQDRLAWRSDKRLDDTPQEGVMRTRIKVIESSYKFQEEPSDEC